MGALSTMPASATRRGQEGGGGSKDQSVRAKTTGRGCFVRVWRTRDDQGEEGRGQAAHTLKSDEDARTRPSPISILIELNATSYLMPETRQKLQLNARPRRFTLSTRTLLLIAQPRRAATDRPRPDIDYLPRDSSSGKNLRFTFTYSSSLRVDAGFSRSRVTRDRFTRRLWSRLLRSDSFAWTTARVSEPCF